MNIKTVLFSILILFCGSNVNVVAQQYKKVVTKTDTFFILTYLDTITIPKGLPNGKWKVYYDNDTSKLHYLFNLKNNNVDGFFMSLNKNSSMNQIGSYYKDSLWTFRTDDIFAQEINSFRICEWRSSYFGSNRFHSHEYKIPYSKNDSIYIDRWFYENGQLLVERKYQLTKGLVEEKYYFTNGRKYSQVENAKNYSTEMKWNENDFLTEVNFEQQFKFQTILDTNETQQFYRCNGCIEQRVEDKNNNTILNTKIDRKGSVMFFNSPNVSLTYDENGFVKRINYANKKGKWKRKKLN
jgi:hypothetical protein